MRAWLREGALARLLAVLDSDGEEARVVGGAVRNALLGEPIGEIDVATTALPAEVIRRAQRAGLQDHPDRESSTARSRSWSTGGRSRSPPCGRTSRHSGARRGLRSAATGRRTPSGATSPSTRCRSRATGRSTIMSAGSPISTSGRIRFIGDPAARIAEDYLRILRFFRFHAHYGEGLPDHDGLAACIAGARRPCDAVARTRARGIAQAPARPPRRAGARGDVGMRIAHRCARRRSAAREPVAT